MNKETRQKHEDRVMTELVWDLTFPGPYTPDEVSTTELIRYSKSNHKNSFLYGMTEKEIRNAIRRLKKKGLIERSWQRMNQDQPSGEYGEVWSDEPFIPHHGYSLTEAGWKSEAAKEAEKIVDREWDDTVKKMLSPETEVED